MCAKKIVPKLESFRKAEIEHEDGKSALFPQCKPLTLSLPTGESATQKIVNKGGAAKVKIFFAIAVTLLAMKFTYITISNATNALHTTMPGNAITNP